MRATSVLTRFLLKKNVCLNVSLLLNKIEINVTKDGIKVYGRSQFAEEGYLQFMCTVEIWFHVM